MVFTCNHCPYALAWHDRIVDVATEYADRGVRFLAVNSNDAERYPHDAPDAMRERVAADGGWPMPYLYDESQEVARAYDARTTPDCFLYRRRGAGSSTAAHPTPTTRTRRSTPHGCAGRHRRGAGGRGPTPAETKPVGCSIKWRQ